MGLHMHHVLPIHHFELLFQRHKTIYNAVNESFTGGTYNRNNIVKFDQHVPAGAAVALGGYVYACPTSWFGGAMDYQGLLKRGTWGTLHEIVTFSACTKPPNCSIRTTMIVSNFVKRSPSSSFKQTLIIH